MADDCVGAEVEKQAGDLNAGEILLLENLRFHPGERENDPEFASRLGALADLYVNDAFGTAHRAHASVVGITRHLDPAASGLLMQKEIEMLSRLRERPEKPYVALLGGAKVSDKLNLIERLLESVDALLIGGAMGHTFLKARGIAVGTSRVEEDRLDAARTIMTRADERGVRLLLPIDHVAAIAPEAGVATEITPDAAIGEGLMGLDVGPQTITNTIRLLNEIPNKKQVDEVYYQMYNERVFQQTQLQKELEDFVDKLPDEEKRILGYQ